MKKLYLTFFAILIAFNFVLAQQSVYTFTTKADVPVTSVKDQGGAGTCWSFATTSFIEAELLRLTHKTYDLSELFFVRKMYELKADRYVRLQGTSNFSQGGQAHDVINAIRMFGVYNEKDYSGLLPGQERYSHSEMVNLLSGMTSALAKSKSGSLSPQWKSAIASILDIYIGKEPASSYNIVKSLPINPDDYIELTSYTHHPFYTKFALEIPDNWSSELYYNVPLNDLMAIIDNALEKGYTVDWDGDVSDKGFSHKNGVAIIADVKLENKNAIDAEKWKAVPEKERASKMYAFESIVPEKIITQEDRQTAFDNFSTTDDHLMHLTGIVTDQNGTKYYKTKNSWGANSNAMGGFLNMSESYVRLNTTAILVHKNAIPDAIRKKLNIL